MQGLYPALSSQDRLQATPPEIPARPLAADPALDEAPRGVGGCSGPPSRFRPGVKTRPRGVSAPPSYRRTGARPRLQRARLAPSPQILLWAKAPRGTGSQPSDPALSPAHRASAPPSRLKPDVKPRPRVSAPPSRLRTIVKPRPWGLCPALSPQDRRQAPPPALLALPRDARALSLAPSPKGRAGGRPRAPRSLFCSPARPRSRWRGVSAQRPETPFRLSLRRPPPATLPVAPGRGAARRSEGAIGHSLPVRNPRAGGGCSPLREGASSPAPRPRAEARRGVCCHLLQTHPLGLREPPAPAARGITAGLLRGPGQP